MKSNHAFTRNRGEGCTGTVREVEIIASYDKYYDNLTKIYFSARWLVRADLQTRDTRRVPIEIESGLGTLK